MLVVAGLSLKNLHPRVWDPASQYFLPSLRGVMVSYGEFHQMPAQMEKAKELGGSFVRKPLYSREGANVAIVVGGEAIDQDEGPYGAEGFVRQAVATLPHAEGNYAALGSWIAAGQACGLSVREDMSPITKNTSRFVPHAIVG